MLKYWNCDLRYGSWTNSKVLLPLPIQSQKASALVLLNTTINILSLSCFLSQYWWGSWEERRVMVKALLGNSHWRTSTERSCDFWTGVWRLSWFNCDITWFIFVPLHTFWEVLGKVREDNGLTPGWIWNRSLWNTSKYNHSTALLMCLMIYTAISNKGLLPFHYQMSICPVYTIEISHDCTRYM